MDVLRHNRTRTREFSFVGGHLGAAAGAEVGLFSVDSSDLPIFSGPPLAAQCPDEERHHSVNPASHPALAPLDLVCSFYLVLVEICNDHADKQGEANHAPQEDKDVDVDAMDLYTRRCLGRKEWIHVKSTQASSQVRRVVVIFNTGPTR